MSASKINEPVVAAIDIGTTYSGYAFSYKYAPLKVYSDAWPNDISANTTKTPTVLLLEADKTFHSFGYKAETDYAGLVSKGHQAGWRYFRRFKMELESGNRQKQGTKISKNLMLEDAQGKQMKAIEVFEHSIRFLKDRVYEKMKRSMTELRPSDIRWVVTVPAIWDNRAKEFMAIAAENAGIERDKLVLAYEPEAAAVFCRDVTLSAAAERRALRPGSQFLVLDLGGGTVDMTALNVAKDGSMDSISPPSGGPWGGTAVDRNFHSFLKEVFGERVFLKWYKEEIEDGLDLDKTFEIKKCTVKPGEKQADGEPGVINIKVSSSIFDILKELRNIDDFNAYIQKTKFAGQVSRNRDKLCFPSELCVEFFRDSKQQILDHLRDILRQLPNVQTILMVGGLSQSTIIEEAVKAEFPYHNVIVPEEPSIAIAKGAVIYGHNPNVIRSRVVPYTYGVSTARPFNENTDPPAKKVRVGDRAMCEDVFDVLVTQGDSIDTQTVHSKTFYAKASVTTAIEIYRSTAANPKFVTDEGCEQEAKLNIFVDSSGTTIGERVPVKVELSFGNTEITVKAGESQRGSMPWRTTLRFI